MLYVGYRILQGGADIVLEISCPFFRVPSHLGKPGVSSFPVREFEKSASNQGKVRDFHHAHLLK